MLGRLDEIRQRVYKSGFHTDNAELREIDRRYLLELNTHLIDVLIELRALFDCLYNADKDPRTLRAYTKCVEAIERAHQ